MELYHYDGEFNLAWRNCGVKNSGDTCPIGEMRNLTLPENPSCIIDACAVFRSDIEDGKDMH